MTEDGGGEGLISRFEWANQVDRDSYRGEGLPPPLFFLNQHKYYTKVVLKHKQRISLATISIRVIVQVCYTPQARLSKSLHLVY